eukprot:scpid111180/ scgid15182/ 
MSDRIPGVQLRADRTRHLQQIALEAVQSTGALAARVHPPTPKLVLPLSSRESTIPVSGKFQCSMTVSPPVLSIRVEAAQVQSPYSSTGRNLPKRVCECECV